jgi:hypothetical protein
MVRFESYEITHQVAPAADTDAAQIQPGNRSESSVIKKITPSKTDGVTQDRQPTSRRMPSLAALKIRHLIPKNKLGIHDSTLR